VKSRHRFILFITALLSFVSCTQNDHKKIVENYFNDYAKTDFQNLSSVLSDSVVIIDGDYRKSYSLTEFSFFYQWDSVFNPKIELLEISSIENNVYVTISTYSKRFEFLESNPLRTKQKISFKENRIHKIEILENNVIYWSVWTQKRDSLVQWTNTTHPELTGFINDLTKTGAENYLKAIRLYKLK